MDNGDVYHHQYKHSSVAHSNLFLEQTRPDKVTSVHSQRHDQKLVSLGSINVVYIEEEFKQTKSV